MDMEERLNLMEQKLIHIKNRNRRLVIGGIVFLGLVLAVVLFVGKTKIASAQPEKEPQSLVCDKIRTRELVLEDKLGNFRASLSVEDGKASMILVGDLVILGKKDGERRVLLSGDEDGSMIGLCNKNGKPCVMLSVNQRGAGVAIADKSKEPRIILAIQESKPLLSFWSRKHKNPGAALSVDDDGAELFLENNNSSKQVKLIAKKGGAGLGIMRAGKSRMSFSLLKNNPSMLLNGDKGNIFVTSDEKEGSFIMLKNGDKIIWETPKP